MQRSSVRFFSKFPRAYLPDEVEKNAVLKWGNKRDFKLLNRKEKGIFSIVLPPPNVTGTLHLGHALTATIQDVLVRWHKMNGFDVVWVPGTDHAGISTQVVVERYLQSEKKLSRHDLGRDLFLKEIWRWKEEKGVAIIEQLHKIGASLDWSKHTFTMDPAHCAAVNHAVVQLWKAGLLYRSEAIVNWSCALRSAISDVEVDHKDILQPTPISVPGYDKPVTFGNIVDFAYKVHNSDTEIVVSTTRMETMLGDVAVAVHPEDTRYTHLHGACLRHPFRSTTIPVICDSKVDRDFGTGAVKITPGHSIEDFNIAKVHNLPILSVINEEGIIIENNDYSLFSGLKRFEAREVVSNELSKIGLLRAIKPHSMQLPLCSRSGDVIEYLLKPQWFLKCKEMADKAAEAVRKGELQIEPAAFHKTWFHWLENIKDWCISRQIWWGHQLPLYQATMNGSSSNWVAAFSLEEAAAKLTTNPENVTQDPDVLDTWFSSALIPFTSFGWPNQTDDLAKYYPLSVLETGHDILFFWVARMVMLGTQLTGEVPFKKILLHGIICDAHGRKMSKSLGNVVRPEDIIKGLSLQGLENEISTNHAKGLMSDQEMQKAISGQRKLFPKGIPECGTDALRFTLLSHNTKSHFINFDVNECLTNRQFCNKIWQACRYTLEWISRLQLDVINLQETHMTLTSKLDLWIISRLSYAESTINSAIQSADFFIATSAIKQFLYSELCDIYLEGNKAKVRENNVTEAQNICFILLYCLNTGLRLSAPIMPFITEELHQYLPGNMAQTMLDEPFPSNLSGRNHKIEDEFQTVMNIIFVIRKMKGLHGSTYQKTLIFLETELKDTLDEYKSLMETLSSSTIEITSKFNLKENAISDTVGTHSSVHFILQEPKNEFIENILKQSHKKEERLKKELDRIINMTSHDGYWQKASEKVKSSHINKMRSLKEELDQLKVYLDNLKASKDKRKKDSCNN